MLDLQNHANASLSINKRLARRKLHRPAGDHPTFVAIGLFRKIVFQNQFQTTKNCLLNSQDGLVTTIQPDKQSKIPGRIMRSGSKNAPNMVDLLGYSCH